MRLSIKKKKNVSINITSLIDVMFLLLIFFMVSSTFIERPGMKLDLPEAETSETTLVKDLNLQMPSDGTVVLNERDISIDNVLNEIKDAISKNNSTTLILQADKSIPHGSVVHVMDEAKKAGVKKIVIAISTPEK